MSHALSTALYQHRARRAIARQKRQQVAERIAASAERRERQPAECPAGCAIPEHEHYAEPNDGCTVAGPHDWSEQARSLAPADGERIDETEAREYRRLGI